MPPQGSALTSTTREGLRQKLDSVVSRMVADGQPDDAIRAVVDDFKGRFYVDTPETPSALDLAGATVGRVASNVVMAPVNIARTAIDAARESTGPMDAGMRIAGRLIVDPMREQGGKTADAAREGRYSEMLGHGLATVIPMFGPMAASAGEKIGTGDPTQIAEAVGDLGSMAVAGPALRLTGRVAQRAGQAAQTAGQSAFLRAAKIPEAVTKKTGTYQRTGDLAAGEAEIAKTVLDRGRGGITRSNVAAMAKEHQQASQRIGDMARTETPIDATPAIRKMTSELTQLGKEADPGTAGAAARVVEMTERMGNTLPSHLAQDLKVGAGARNANRYSSPTHDPAVSRVDMAMRSGLKDAQNQAIPGFAEANAEFAAVKAAAVAMSKARQRIGHTDPVGLTQAVMGALGMPGLLTFLQRGGTLSQLAQGVYSAGAKTGAAGRAMATGEAAKAALLAQLLGQE